jgi:hypothetical protein
MGNPNGHLAHGMRHTGTYQSWADMKTRVLNRNCKDHRYYKKIFGDIEPRWLSFEEFYKDMGNRPEGLTLDRIDNSRGYFPWNCQWASRAEQARNKRNNSISEDKAREIKELVGVGLNDSEIGKLMGCTNSVVYNVRHGRSWQEASHV